jgi:hypothetical protein
MVAQLIVSALAGREISGIDAASARCGFSQIRTVYSDTWRVLDKIDRAINFEALCLMGSCRQKLQNDADVSLELAINALFPRLSLKSVPVSIYQVPAFTSSCTFHDAYVQTKRSYQQSIATHLLIYLSSFPQASSIRAQPPDVILRH